MSVCHDCLEDRPCSCDRLSAALNSRRGKVRPLYRKEHLDAAVAKAIAAERVKTAAELISVLVEIDRDYGTDWVTAVQERSDDFDWDAVRARGKT